ncbi:MAG: hypothetical protein ACKO0V_17070 [bacterium]
MTQPFLRLLCLASVVAAPAGCSQERPLPNVPEVAVSGRISRGGRPLQAGWVEIVPVDGGQGVLRSGEIGRDGLFEVTRLGPGKHGVRVVVPRDKSLFPFDQFYSPIRRTLTDQPQQQMEINLDSESRQLN